MGIKYETLVEHYKKDSPAAHRGLTDAIKKREIRPSDFDLGRLFEACFGWHEFQACRNDRSRLVNTHVAEAAGAVASSTFANITGQIVYSALLESYDAPEFVFKGMIPEVMTPFLQGEKIAGINGLGDVAEVVGENDPYPLVGPSEDWINTPALKKRGAIVPVTREAIFSDRTGLLLERCSKVGYWMGYNDELRAIDCIIDENAGAASAMVGGHRYHRKDASIATYGDNSGTHDWDNLSATTALVDWTDFEAMELLLSAMADPGTGIVTGAYRSAASQVIVTTQNIHTARHILNATELRMHVGGYATSGNLVERSSPNSIQMYQIVSTPLLDARLGTDTSWFLGNVGKAFRKMVAWRMETTQAPANSHEEFNRDIVSQYKASQMDAYTTFDPRYMVKATA